MSLSWILGILTAVFWILAIGYYVIGDRDTREARRRQRFYLSVDKERLEKAADEAFRAGRAAEAATAATDPDEARAHAEEARSLSDTLRTRALEALTQDYRPKLEEHAAFGIAAQSRAEKAARRFTAEQV